jgi:hypothetical protein
MVLWVHETALTTESETATWFMMSLAAGFSKKTVSELFNLLKRIVENKINVIRIYVYNVDKTASKTLKNGKAILAVLSSGLNRPERGNNHSNPSSAEIKNRLNYNSTPLICIRRVYTDTLPLLLNKFSSSMTVQICTRISVFIYSHNRIPSLMTFWKYLALRRSSSSVESNLTFQIRT